PQDINDGLCDVSVMAEFAPGEFDPRPVGGAVLIEGNIEARFPVWRDRVIGAAFVDFGQIWQTRGDVGFDELAWTPGIGIRYMSPIGPIRIDVGYNPSGAQVLPVVTNEVCHRVGDVCNDIEPGVIY